MRITRFAVLGLLLIGAAACDKGCTREADPATPAAAPGDIPAPPDVAAPPSDAARTSTGLASKVL